MSIRFSVAVTSAEARDEDVLIDAHHISTDREWFEHPIRSHRLRIGHSLHLLAHVALGFKLHRGARDELCVNVSHHDPGASHALELVSVTPRPRPATSCPAPSCWTRLATRWNATWCASARARAPPSPCYGPMCW